MGFEAGELAVHKSHSRKCSLERTDMEKAHDAKLELNLMNPEFLVQRLSHPTLVLKKSGYIIM